ncbi:MAG: quinone-dependent dihydroorotate dehydrogenase [Bacteroidetes bacterium]|nr:quinone-dependent dihydroorotate dehydrogenase [Bacteroidota bacterium]
MYKLFIRPILFLFPPEISHRIVVVLLKIPGISFLLGVFYKYEDVRLEKNVLGLKFPNPVGLAAGFDKEATFFDEISNCGFGFIEVGTVTPKPQQGNNKPRLFRLKEDEALINRMGFNNDGVEAMVERLKCRKNFKVIIGGNIGKNKVTLNENAIADYEYCFEKLYDYVDYFVVNVSSPNTPNLRVLQEKEPLKNILHRLMELREAKSHESTAISKKSILLKIAPDLTNEQLDDIVEIIRETKIDGVVATNTTISRENLLTPKSTLQTIGAGGLSGKPLTKRATEVIKYLSEKSGRSFSIIASGGIHTAEDAIEKLNAGASLVQVYTGFIYEGPAIVKRIFKGLLEEN